MQTPLIQSKKLSALNHCNVWLKMESAHVTGSFKERSIRHACLKYLQKGAKRLISSSGGNAGISVAHIGHQLNISVVIVVPITTSKIAIDRMQQANAEVIIHGESWFEANELAQSYIDSESIYIHPFDDQYLWDGVSHIIDEVIQDGIKPDAVILSVGGGSLLSGIYQGLNSHALNIPIYAIETEGTASLNTAIRAQKHIKLDRITGIAPTLGAKQVCANAFEISKKGNIVGLTVSDQDALHACFKFLDDHRVLVEPACGAALSVLYDQKICFSAAENILVIVCGGATVTLNSLLNYAKEISLETK